MANRIGNTVCCQSRLAFVCIILFYICTTNAELTCPDGWTLFFPEQTCGKLFEEPKSWEDARANCQANEGDLITVRSAAKTGFATDVSSNRVYKSWIGLTSVQRKDVNGTRKYQWVSDDYESDEPTFTRLTTKKNSPAGVKLCYVLNLYNGDCNEDDCHTALSYFCERPAYHIATRTCPEEWRRHRSRCFRVVKDVWFQWKMARENCLSQNSYLASIPDSSTQTFIEEDITNVQQFKPFWIGLKENDNDKYEWVDQGIPVSYDNWGVGEPNRYVHKGCVSIARKTWSAEDCSGLGPFICEKTVSKVDLTCDDSWDLNEKYEICTKRFFSEESWNVARSKCLAKGGDLIKIEDLKLNEYIRSRLGKSSNKCFWIGLRTAKDVTMYQWVGEKRVADFTILDYLSSTPRFGTDTCICLSGKDDNWSQVNCSTSASYICEKRPHNMVECPQGYVKHQLGKTCIKLKDDPEEWENARASCQLEGGDLLTIPNSDTDEFINDLISKHGSGGYYWIGLHDRRVKNHFQWLDDETKQLNFTYWQPGQPDRNSKKHCVLINGDISSHWINEYCVAKMKFVCQRPATVDGVPPHIKTIPSIRTPCGRGYDGRRPDSFYCYRVNTEPLDWVDAQQSCSITGGDLVSFLNVEETLYLKGKLSKLSMKGTMFWTGGNNRASYKGWEWDDGTPFAFLNWDFGQPSEKSDNNCIGVNEVSGRWKTLNCETHLPSVCKKTILNTTSLAPKSTAVPTNTSQEIMLGCKLGWDSFKGSCYYVHSTKSSMDWIDAKKACNAYSSNLASISDGEENDFIFSLLHGKVGHAWIGLSNSKIRNSFEWSDGRRKVTYTNWNNWQPEVNGKDTACVAMKELTGRWDVKSCLAPQNTFVCKANTSIQSNTDAQFYKGTKGCLKGGDGYLNRCYVNRNTEKTYDEAQRACKSLGGNLAAVKDRFIQGFIISALPTSRYWIGLNNISPTKVSDSRTIPYVWVTGDDVDFTNWGRDFTGKKSDTCVGIDNTAKPIGLWKTYSCTQTMPFICEYNRSGFTTPKNNIQSTPISTIASCPEDWINVSNMCYMAFADSDPASLRTWMEAKSYCESLVSGGTLASISSSEISNKIKRLINVRNNNIDRRLWLGLNDKDDEGSYHWADGQPFLYQNWAKGQPNDFHGRQDCTAWDVQRNGKWNDYNCYKTLGHICQARTGSVSYTTVITPTANSSDASRSHCGEGPWSIFQGDCYMLAGTKMSEQKDWFDASDACRKIGADLVSITDEAENGHVTSLINKLKTIVSFKYYWIGLNDFDGDVYTWTDRSPNYFFSWLPGEPNNGDGGERCVRIESDGGWSDCSCHTLLPYVCKKTPGKSSPKHKDTPVPPKGGCPDKFFAVPETSQCFFIGGQEEEDRKTFYEARDACKTVFSKSRLASIHSRFDEEFVITLLSKLKAPAWIGLKALYSRQSFQENFKWLDDTKRNYAHWGRDQPVGIPWKNGLLCVGLAIKPNRAGDWANMNCNDKLAYVCEYRKDILFQKNKPNTDGCSNGYRRFQGSCYKYVSTPTNWSQSEEMCVQDGGHLACIQGRYESAFIEVTSWSKQAKESWIGLHQNSEKSAFTWIDGWPVMYTSWGRDQPDISIEKQCVVLQSGSKWATNSCSKELPFVCEVSIDAPPSQQPPSVPGKCSNDLWTHIGGDCYHIEADAPKTWPEANFECQSMGGQLASIHSPNQAKVVTFLIGLERADAWIGLLRLGFGDFEWSDRTETEFLNWASGSPFATNTTKNQACVLAQGVDGKWTAVDCYTKLGYLCQTMQISLTNDSSTSTTVSDTVTPGEKKSQSTDDMGVTTIAAIVLGAAALIAVFIIIAIIVKRAIRKQPSSSSPKSFENKTFDPSPEPEMANIIVDS